MSTRSVVLIGAVIVLCALGLYGVGPGVLRVLGLLL